MIISSGTRHRERNQRGSAAVEITMLVPALLLTLGLIVVGGRVWFARTTVNEAAHAAARAPLWLDRPVRLSSLVGPPAHSPWPPAAYAATRRQ